MILPNFRKLSLNRAFLCVSKSSKNLLWIKNVIPWEYTRGAPETTLYIGHKWCSSGVEFPECVCRGRKQKKGGKRGSLKTKKKDLKRSHRYVLHVHIIIYRGNTKNRIIRVYILFFGCCRGFIYFFHS